MAAAKPILTKAERDGAVWQKVEAHLKERLAQKRKALENPGTPSAQRDELAYRIDEIKNFLRLGAEE